MSHFDLFLLCGVKYVSEKAKDEGEAYISIAETPPSQLTRLDPTRAGEVLVEPGVEMWCPCPEEHVDMVAKEEEEEEEEVEEEEVEEEEVVGEEMEEEEEEVVGEKEMEEEGKGGVEEKGEEVEEGEGEGEGDCDMGGGTDGVEEEDMLWEEQEVKVKVEKDEEERCVCAHITCTYVCVASLYLVLHSPQPCLMVLDSLGIKRAATANRVRK